MPEADVPTTPAPKGPGQGPAATTTSRNIQILAGVVFLALVVVVFVVVAGGSKPKTEAPKVGQQVQGISETKTLLAGIEQHGFTLGDPKAPISVVEFLDVQCPYCRDHQLDEQPTVIKDLVRTGKATLTMQPIDLLGGDSQPGRVVLARAATLNHAWDFLNLWYWNQGTENSGYVTGAYLHQIADATATATASASGVASVDTATTPDATGMKQLAEVDALRKTLAVQSTPSFFIGRTGQPLASFKGLDITQTSRPAGQQIVEAVTEAAANAGA